MILWRAITSAREQNSKTLWWHHLYSHKLSNDPLNIPIASTYWALGGAAPVIFPESGGLPFKYALICTQFSITTSFYFTCIALSKFKAENSWQKKLFNKFFLKIILKCKIFFKIHQIFLKIDNRDISITRLLNPNIP